MASDTLAEEFRAELILARDTLTPQLKGLQILTMLPLSPDADSVVDTEISIFQNRLSLINSTIGSIDALLAGGYPTDLASHVSSAILAELKGQLDAIAEALKEFTADSEASAATITAGTPRLKK